MKLSTFRRGGVHPDDKKLLSKDKKLERLPFPSELIVSASEHLGAPAVLTKKKGDPVTRGEVIGTAAGNLCTAAPAADCAAMLYALNASVVLESEKGKRVVALADFYDTSSANPD